MNGARERREGDADRWQGMPAAKALARIRRKHRLRPTDVGVRERPSSGVVSPRTRKRPYFPLSALESGDRIELFYEDSPEATIRATVNRLLSDRDEGMGLV